MPSNQTTKTLNHDHIMPLPNGRKGLIDWMERDFEFKNGVKRSKRFTPAILRYVRENVRTDEDTRVLLAGYTANCAACLPICHCGKPIHYTDMYLRGQVERFIARSGRFVRVEVAGGGAWMVDRHYIALHGIKAAELPTLGFEKAV